MPYVSNYLKIIDKTDIEYNLIIWNRLNISENIKGYIYTDKKVKFSRNYFDYMQFCDFIISHLEKDRYDRIIVFTMQIGHFLKKYLIENYSGEYILDIRDYNRIYAFSNFQPLVNHSFFTTISSFAYKTWLPKSNKYIVNHNTAIDSIVGFTPINSSDESKRVIATIGVLSDLAIMRAFVNEFGNSSKFDLKFYGDGILAKKLNEYVEEKGYLNISFYGRYRRADEEGFFNNADIICALRRKNTVNLRTALPNKLYNAVIYGKPLLALEGTYLSQQIQKYNLGFVAETLDNLEDSINRYLDLFNQDEYAKSRIDFLETVIKENQIFEDSLIAFFQ